MLIWIGSLGLCFAHFQAKCFINERSFVLLQLLWLWLRTVWMLFPSFNRCFRLLNGFIWIDFILLKHDFANSPFDHKLIDFVAIKLFRKPFPMEPSFAIKCLCILGSVCSGLLLLKVGIDLFTGILLYGLGWLLKHYWSELWIPHIAILPLTCPLRRALNLFFSFSNNPIKGAVI